MCRIIGVLVGVRGSVCVWFCGYVCVSSFEKRGYAESRSYRETKAPRDTYRNIKFKKAGKPGHQWHLKHT